jgi:transcription antitermination factor NusG
VHTAVAIQWYAIRVRTRFERTVAEALSGKGYEAWLPVRVNKRRWKDRVASVEAPLFQGYVLGRLDAHKRLPVLTIPGVRQIVGFDGQPAPIPDREIRALQAAIASGREFGVWPYLREGHRVRVIEGPLRGVEGILVQVRETSQIVLSINLLQRSVAVQFERDSVEPIPESSAGLSQPPVRRVMAAGGAWQ